MVYGGKTRVFARSSAFEGLLSKVYMEIWALQDHPAMFADRVEKFVNTWLPSMFQKEIIKKMPDFEEKVKELEDSLEALREASKNADPLTQEQVTTQLIPEKVAILAADVWHAVIDVLTEAGFNFPYANETPYRKMA